MSAIVYISPDGHKNYFSGSKSNFLDMADRGIEYRESQFDAKDLKYWYNDDCAKLTIKFRLDHEWFEEYYEFEENNDGIYR